MMQALTILAIGHLPEQERRNSAAIMRRPRLEPAMDHTLSPHARQARTLGLT